MSDAAVTQSSSRLLLPLVIVSTLCGAQAIVIAFLLGRGHATPPPPHPTKAEPAAATHTRPADGALAAAPAPIARGHPGQRVDSSGIAMTVVNVSNEPRFKEVFTPPPSQEFFNIELLIENATPRAFAYYSNQFTLKDDKDRPYSPTSLGAGEPALNWGTIVPGEKVRGHIAFVVPRNARNLALTYPVSTNPTDARTIQIRLGR